MQERANRLAHHLAAHGVGPGDHVGIYAYNSVEWVETLWAVFKIRAVWVNINYRYVEDELAYLFDNADLKALVYQREFAPRVRGVLDRLPLLPRSASDRYILYTGGTTGMPKGVVWRHEDVFFALGGGIDVVTGAKAVKPEDMVERA